ncbi:Protein kinase domain family protein [Clavispora lusitaniae]|uniref:non-specific serine/threonine protein kinase n=1 Tax=Clavispora lusitaniae (strain ATCC 42720) TaxID=306902 RepID=C4Y7Z0_CLAL4|nr:uncharacterized protein CLUG_04318 [Clavispora lusitaniae ATCC 42720]EEQ40190.1 hypothetical protein CLUG_04318 [Clavispora lusitaniae ATCC 42720]KAF7581862.1 Protein kinase domain family protein [Clavispora lusitaniae]
MPQPPPNAFAPGTRLTVGSHRVTIASYLSSGGFAHVYTCQIEPSFHGSSTACLKRVVVPNKQQLALLRQEVDAMKRLRGNSHIVSYIDSHAARLPLTSDPAQGSNASAQSQNQTQQYEVLLLMEYCAGNGLIDFMNQRLTNRLTEREVLSIAAQVTTGVAMCHHLTPPLIHRDIKIENVLIDADGSYKLCDFGSAVGYIPIPSTADELQLTRQDIMRHTTPQYRAPEMIEVGRFPIDDKSDVWALGVLIYKLCYYTTPFESPHHQTMNDLERSILQCHTTLRFPGSPQYSQRLQNIIRCCLRPDPRRRPNAVQLLQEICSMQGSRMPEVVPHAVRSQRPVVKVSAAPKAQTMPIPQMAGVPSGKSPVAPPSKSPTAPVIKSPVSVADRKARPKSMYLIPDSSASLQDLIQQQVHDTSHDLTNMRKSEELDRGTLDFLRSKDGPLRNDTGNSLKASLKNGLRRISTGGSVKSQRVESGDHRGKQRSTSQQGQENYRSTSSELKRRSSIQKRVSQLFSNRDKKVPKSAVGYGKYTDQDDITAINNTDLSTSDESLERPSSRVSYYDFDKKSSKTPEPEKKHEQKEIKVEKTLNNKVENKTGNNAKGAGVRHKYGSLARKHEPPPCPPSLSHTDVSGGGSTKTRKPLAPKKAPPPKPKKPSRLKLLDTAETRRLSTSSEISMPDLDDLEKQFARRFPSYV